MDTGQIIAFGFLVVVGLPLLLRVLSSTRAFQQGAVWILIFLGTVAAIGLWDDISSDLRPRSAIPLAEINGSVVEIPVGNDGHFHLTLRVNNVPVNFLIDTGATQVVLTQQDAIRVGLDPANLAYIGRANTANGEVNIAPVKLDHVALGDIVDRGLRASVNGGEMDGSLLGMSYLSRFQSIEIRPGWMILRR